MQLRGSHVLLGPLLVVGILPAGLVAAQAGKRLSAREIFYSAPAEPPPAKKTAPQPAVKAKKKAATETASARNTPQARPAQTSVVPVSYTTGATFPLGVRYSILKRAGGESEEVAPDTVFRSGDRIRLRVETNDSGYLYIINRGSSGNWKPLFPSPEIAGGDNRVEKGRPHEIPSGYVFTFDEQPGEEKLFIVFSRQPVSDLEGLIYSLSGSQTPAEPVSAKAPKQLLAQNMVSIGDGTIDRLRNVYARDLIIEKVDETSPPAAAAPAKEKAVYVVNPSRSGESRVVADVTLNHK